FIAELTTETASKIPLQMRIISQFLFGRRPSTTILIASGNDHSSSAAMTAQEKSNINSPISGLS
ncbi:hypothetical protein ACPCYY_20975, partial [Bacillus pumilus]|uniref:hypothetical protein n=1 Tax=Bacillus pumilus TaxID=1408 RepID=UPI003C1D81B3